MKKRLLTYLLAVLLLTAAGCGQSEVPQNSAVLPADQQAHEPARVPDVQPDGPPAQQLPPVEAPAQPTPQPAPEPQTPAVEEPAEPQPEPSVEAEHPPEEQAPQPEQPEVQPPPPPQPVIEPAETQPQPPEAPALPVYTQEVPVTQQAPVEEAAVLQQAPPAVAATVQAVPSGRLEKRCDKAVIDYSNTGDGYVMVQYTAATAQKLKCRVTGPSTTYTYNLTAGQWATFSLSDGDGSYTVSVFENVVDTKYATVLTVSFEVKTQDEFAPFLLPNQYVDYKNAPNTVAKAAELTQNTPEPLKKVEAVYDFVVTNLTYDKQLAQTVQSGYLPVLDTVLEKKTGICFDYAALMAGMLRSQGIPCKLVVGYAGEAYHAWISVWTEETGWVDGIIFFDGHAWKRMDPTFASSANASADIMAYIGNGANYTAKYVY